MAIDFQLMRLCLHLYWLWRLGLKHHMILFLQSASNLASSRYAMKHVQLNLPGNNQNSVNCNPSPPSVFRGSCKFKHPRYKLRHPKHSDEFRHPEYKTRHPKYSHTSFRSTAWEPWGPMMNCTWTDWGLWNPRMSCISTDERLWCPYRIWRPNLSHSNSITTTNTAIFKWIESIEIKLNIL